MVSFLSFLNYFSSLQSSVNSLKHSFYDENIKWLLYKAWADLLYSLIQSNLAKFNPPMAIFSHHKHVYLMTATGNMSINDQLYFLSIDQCISRCINVILYLLQVANSHDWISKSQGDVLKLQNRWKLGFFSPSFPLITEAETISSCTCPFQTWYIQRKSHCFEKRHLAATNVLIEYWISPGVPWSKCITENSQSIASLLNLFL